MFRGVGESRDITILSMLHCIYIFSISELLEEAQNLMPQRENSDKQKKSYRVDPSQHKEGHTPYLSLVLGVLHALAPTVMELD